MKVTTGMKKREEIVVCMRDMVFVVCGTVLVIAGHIWFGVAAFICAGFRFEIGNYVVFARAIRKYSGKVRTMRETVDRIVSTAKDKGLMSEEMVKAYRETVK